MTKIEEAKKILDSIGMTKDSMRYKCLTLLTLANIHENDDWKNATDNWIRNRDVIDFGEINYNINYAPNSREGVRKNAFHPFMQAALVDKDLTLPVNSSKTRYKLTPALLNLIRKFNSDEWDKALKDFLLNHESLKKIYESKKTMNKLPVCFNGDNYKFSLGKHNQLQKAILEEFAPRFAPNTILLYIGDTAKKDLVIKKEKLKEIGLEITLHNKMPDVVLYREDKDWIYFIEAFASTGPMEPKRIIEINEMTKNVKASKIFVTAFLDFKTYKKHSDKLAWETEVWIAEMPEHMIHLNGNKFLGPR